MNSVVATPPVPPHFHESTRLSPSRSIAAPQQGNNRKRKADDDNHDQDIRMSASPSDSPAFTPRSLPSHRQIKRTRPNLSGRPLSLPRLLETLDTTALRSILQSLCDNHPTLTDEVVHTAPRPSVAATLQVLHNYQSTLQHAFPLGGNPSSDYSYNRVRQHLSHLLDALGDFTPQFLPPNEIHVSTCLSYLDGATEIIHRLPQWNTPHHNLDREAAYEEISKAWVLVIREAAKRGGGIQLQYGGWDQKLAKHNQESNGKLQEALNELSSSLGWMGGPGLQTLGASHGVGGDISSIREQLLSGTYGMGVPLKVGPW